MTAPPEALYPGDLPEPDRATMVEVNATTLRIWEWGDPSHPPIFCAHGAFDHGRMWDEMAPAVAALGYHVRALDLRGHGDSGRLPHGHTFPASVIDLGTLMLLEEQPVGLLAHSMGSGMAMQSAAVWPELVRWVVSIDSLGPPRSHFEDVDLQQVTRERFDYIVKQSSRSARVFPDQQAMQDQRARVNTRVPERWIAHMVRHGTLPVDGGFRWKWDSLFNTSLPDGFTPEWVQEDFKVLDRPVLVLMGGEEDMWSDMPDDEVAANMALFSDARLHTIAGGGHYLHLEQPRLALAAIEDFLHEIGDHPGRSE